MKILRVIQGFILIFLFAVASVKCIKKGPVPESASKYYAQKLDFFTEKQPIVCSDWDEVISDCHVFKMGFGALTAGSFRLLWALRTYVINKHFRRDIRQAIGRKLTNKQGHWIKGSGNFLRHFAQYDPTIMNDYDAMVRAINITAPIYSTVEQYQTLQCAGAPLFIWTDNDKESLFLKLEDLNVKLTKKQQEPLFIDGYFVAGWHPEDVPVSVYDIPGKPGETFFVKAYAHTMDMLKERGFDSEQVFCLFIDDKAENVIGARKTAEKHGLNLVALHYTSDMQLKADLALFASVRSNVICE